MPHLLIAGATGTGKSVALNTLLVSMLLRSGPRALRLVLIDAKRVELSPYATLPHLSGPIVTETADAEAALQRIVRLMESRYSMLDTYHVRSVDDLPNPLPRWVVVVDELADLVMSSKTVSALLVRLAQKSRAAGIHLVLATQRPSTDVISGLLKANVPARMALAVASNVDSRVILDSAGAEDLLGRGDMLCRWPWTLDPIRVQGAMVTDAEISAVVARWTPPPAPQAPTVAPQGPTTWERVTYAAGLLLAGLCIVASAWLVLGRI
jgi:S-DNA-T family DNA segregation ATPase FtsK/SpoIIIE